MGKIAFLFSGQGGQYSGMGKELYEISPKAREVFDRADSIRPHLKELCFTADKSELSKTINTQPTLFCVDLAAAEILSENGVSPSAVAGFSLGEIPALAFAGKLCTEDAFSFVCRRAELMSNCADKNKGVMLAVIGLSGEDVEDICKTVDKTYPVNYNYASQTVVACAECSADILEEKVKARGAKAVKLAVSGAFHSPFMQEAYTVLLREYQDMQLLQTDIPVYANLTGKPYEDINQLFLQVCSPVKWQKTIENMVKDGIDTFIEVGAGKILSSMIRKIESSVNVFNVEDKASLEKVLEFYGGHK